MIRVSRSRNSEPSASFQRDTVRQLDSQSTPRRRCRRRALLRRGQPHLDVDAAVLRAPVAEQTETVVGGVTSPGEVEFPDGVTRLDRQRLVSPSPEQLDVANMDRRARPSS